MMFLIQSNLASLLKQKVSLDQAVGCSINWAIYLVLGYLEYSHIFGFRQFALFFCQNIEQWQNINNANPVFYCVTLNQARPHQVSQGLRIQCQIFFCICEASESCFSQVCWLLNKKKIKKGERIKKERKKEKRWFNLWTRDLAPKAKVLLCHCHHALWGGGGMSVGGGISLVGFHFGPFFPWLMVWHLWGRINQRSHQAWTTVCSKTKFYFAPLNFDFDQHPPFRSPLSQAPPREPLAFQPTCVCFDHSRKQDGFACEGL